MSIEPILVLFDCDGTLIDSAGTIAAVMHRTFDEAGEKAVTDAAVRDIIGLSLPFAIGRLLSIDAASSKALHLTDAYKTHYTSMKAGGLEREPAYDGIPELLETLRTMGPILGGVVTGKSRRGLNQHAEQHGFDWLVPISRTADDCASKPAPDMVLECCAQAGIDEARTLVIGDTSYDMTMAKAAGARAVGVSWGYHKPDSLVEAGAETVLQHPSDLLPIIEQALNNA